MAALLKFTKMHGLGNDFAVLYGAQNRKFSLSLIPSLAHRQTGIGFDQLLWIIPQPNQRYLCRIFNADGREAEQCGNGLRCVARYLHEEGLVTANDFAIATIAGNCSVTIKDYEHITITLPLPIIQQQLTDLLNDQQTDLTYLSTGNPHIILKVPTVHADDVIKLTKAINIKHPEGINIGFMEINSPQAIRLKTYERGVGFTNACGSNACAAVFTGYSKQWLAAKVTVELPLGTLDIAIQKQHKQILLTGPASHVYQGELDLGWL